ncbi:methyltransferase [Nocardiopsis sp. B62]|uniref:methyltransferase n=1 Tax=Nocardiopsis sp. B62 TaxID=2824874 RepID=UPI0027DC2D7F|nr:methyltransferase [Nocardiopsis sp. B62]
MSTPPLSPVHGGPTPLSGPAVHLFELITSSWVAAAVSAAAELGVADAMSGEPTHVDEIAKLVEADTDALHRLLRACADLGVVEEHPGRNYALTELGRALRSDAPDSMRGFARWLGSPAERSTMAHLADAVRVGGPVFEAVHGVPVWDYMRANPNSASVFDQGMTDISSQLTRSLVDEYDFADSECLVDVGGGRGRLLSLILTANPHLRGVLYDRPEVVSQLDPALGREGVAERCRVESGSFLDSVPAGGDTYLLASVIHNWNDADTVRILTHCRTAMTAEGRVLLAEVLVPERPEPARTAKFMDLSMLVHCDGKQRTRSEFAEVAERSGLRLNRVVPGLGVSVVELVRA